MKAKPSPRAGDVPPGFLSPKDCDKRLDFERRSWNERYEDQVKQMKHARIEKEQERKLRHILTIGYIALVFFLLTGKYLLPFLLGA